jgi:CRP/FNR family cyclic AMP-dependent transcriptional regulator
MSLANDNLREAIKNLAKEITVAKGEELFSQGDPGGELYFVDEGSIEISVISSEGRKLSLNIMQPGDVFGEIAFLDGSSRTATSTAMEQSKLRRVRRIELLHKMETQPDLAMDFIKLLCNRLRWVHGLLEDRAFLSLSNRLAKRLLILLEQMGNDSHEIRLSQSELADYLGATREGVAKVLGSWRSRGWIDLERGVIRLKNIQRLWEISESADF